MGNECKICQKFNQRTRQCKVMKKLIKECWAWTDDPGWEEKVKKAIDEYMKKDIK